MKVILIKDVAKVGRRYEVKDLADGYARNFILARGLGLVANEANLKQLNRLKEDYSGKASAGPDLSGVSVMVTAKANAEGHLFAAIHSEIIADALVKQQKVKIDPKNIEIPEPIKSVGDHQVRVNYDAKTSTFLTVRVRPS